MMHEEQRMRISQYVDAELDLSEEQGLFVHLAQCEECREFLRHSLRLRADMADDPSRSWEERRTRIAMPRSIPREQIGVKAKIKRDRVRVFALVLITVLVTGLTWTRTIPKQREANVDLTREALQLEMMIHQH
jgi:hypothetical protein